MVTILEVHSSKDRSLKLSSMDLENIVSKRASKRALMGSSESVDLATTEVTVTQHIMLDWYLLFENRACQ